MAATHDIVIVGAGHNGLVAAYYLAKAGLKPLVLERRPLVGGCAITDYLHPGFKCSTLAHVSGPIDRRILRDMKLDRLGLQMFEPEVQVFAPSPDGHSLVFYADPARSAQEIAKTSSKDAESFSEFSRVLGRLGKLITRVMSVAPPSLDHPTAGDIWNLLLTAKEFRSLGKKDMFRLLRWVPMPVADLVAEWFEGRLLQAIIAARGIFGTFLGPRSPGSSAVLLVRAAAEGSAVGSTAFAKGGMGALTRAMSAAAIQAGAEIRAEAEVSRIAAKEGAVRGVVLASGEEITAKAVMSNADPRRTFLRLVDPAYLEPEFLVRVQNYRCAGTVAKVNLALSGLPRFTALESATPGSLSPSGQSGATRGAGGRSAPAALAGRIHVGPEVDYLERAFDAAKYGEYSREPFLDILIPSVLDRSLTPPGQHVMSITVQFAPYRLRNGDWNEHRDGLGDTVIKTLSAYAPDLPGLVLCRQVITPRDLEETYGLTGGHIFHGELALDQLFTMRPFLGWARYRTPLKGLYLCGSGTHPGIGLTGISGRNAAHEILKDWRKLKRA